MLKGATGTLKGSLRETENDALIFKKYNIFYCSLNVPGEPFSKENPLKNLCEDLLSLMN